jgi:hypothetical protein
MAAPSFDATHAIQFDLGRGSVRSRAEQESILLVPASTLADLIATAPIEAAQAFGRALGAAIGRRARAGLSDVTEASIEAVVAQLAGEAALAGMGVVSIERWGRAVVVLVEGSPLASSVLAPLVASALQTIFDRDIWCALLSGEGHPARILIASERGAERVRDWIASGVPWGAALTRLQGGTA